MQRSLYCPEVALGEILLLVKEMAESQVSGILPQSSLKTSGSLRSHHRMRVFRQLSSMDLLMQLFLLCLILSFACPKCKKRNHQIKNCVILDLLIDLDFVHKPFPKVANWPSSCVMLQNASNCLANTWNYSCRNGSLVQCVNMFS